MSDFGVSATKAAVAIACGGAGYAIVNAFAPGSGGGGLSLGVAVGNILQGVVSNYAKDAGDWLSGRAGRAFLRGDGPATNHDLDDLAAQAIAKCIGIAEGYGAGTGGVGPFAASLSRAEVSVFRDLLREASFAEVDDAATLMLIGQDDGGIGTTAGTSAYWSSYVRALASKLQVDEPSDDAVTFVAGWVHRQIAAQANDILRNTFGDKGRAYVAVQMLFARQTLSAVVGGNETTHARLNEVLARLEQIAPGTRQSVDEHIAEHARIAAEQATAANAKADQILAAVQGEGAMKYLEDLAPPRPLKYIARPGRMQALVDALWKQGRASVSGRGASAGARAAAQGEGGQGKSVLALAYAEDYADRYPGGCYRVVVENQSLEAALARMIPALPALSQMPQADKARLARAFLSREPKCLLIVDNVDRLSDWNDPAFQDLLPSGECHVIVTSREEGLPGIAHVNVGKLEEQEAQAVLVAYRPSAADAAHDGAVKTILRSVERLAVAVASVGALMSVAEDDDWTAYASRLAAIPLEEYPERYVEVAGHTRYSRRIFAALDDLFARLPPPAQRAMHYAALLPEDMIPAVDHVSGNPATVTPADWLSLLLAADADPAKAAAPLELGTRPTGRPWEPRDFVKKLQSLGLFTPANPERTLWSLHRLHAKRIHERAASAKYDAAPLWSALAACAVAREAVIVKGENGTGRGTTDHPAVLINQSLRWELTPLAAVCSMLWARTARPEGPEGDTGGPNFAGAAAGIGVWLAPVLRQMGRLTEAAASLMLTRYHEPEIELALGTEAVAVCYSNLALIQRDQGDLPAARWSIERAIAIDAKHFAPDHPTLAIRYNNLAQIQQRQGDLPGAWASIERAIAIDAKHFPPDHPIFAVRYNNMATIQRDQGDLPGARTSIERAIAIYAKHFGPGHPTLAANYNNLAHICLSEGDTAGACLNFRNALSILHKHFDENHPDAKNVRESMKTVGCSV